MFSVKFCKLCFLPKFHDFFVFSISRKTGLWPIYHDTSKWTTSLSPTSLCSNRLRSSSSFSIIILLLLRAASLSSRCILCRSWATPSLRSISPISCWCCPSSRSYSSLESSDFLSSTVARKTAAFSAISFSSCFTSSSFSWPWKVNKFEKK